MKRQLYVVLLLVLQLSLHAEEEMILEEHVVVGEREMDLDQRDALQNKRSEQESDRPEFTFAPRALQEPKFSLTRSYYYNPNSLSTHWLIGICDSNRAIELEDGSHWEISPFDAHLIYTWRIHDLLVVSPNYSWFSSFDYYITNRSNNSCVKANLSVGPLLHSTYSHWIVEIDYLSGHVFLEDHSIWCVHPTDASLLIDWSVNDHMIIGEGNGCYSSYDQILINANMDNYARVKQY
ncbi:MAG: hypothetical protein JSS61_07115 [Verrucomicrobia bacterium]|nr:hypothetical protein [Verrucomicrobiota bacterium]